MSLRDVPRLSARDALIIVDVQRDFCPGGALAVPEGDRVVPVLNAWIDEAARAGALVVATRDFHPPEHASFHARSGPWPAHCVQGTEGAELHPDLRLPSTAPLLSKGQHPDRDAYSAFDDTQLSTMLEARGVQRVFVGGLAQDVCVRATVLDALRLGYEAHLIVPATRPVDTARGEHALHEMRDKGATLEQ